ncbi:TetR family transcriptional regulator [Streptomyces sp. LP11]|uniref:TetR family transcriptional regulator n=1 Tax=Streptomyces pyxinicus TaxID=2970331 RepID=A0ABT2B1N5_9ACTN|nr:TetR family transcriptional regulator [Streptomyces sp. LP11]MCS0602428.1 TetR family transcriptional regulator [Streptomyces sp. LP11]
MPAARSRTSAPAAPASSSGPRPGLRERKKLRTREAIRAATYALVEERGYDAATVERIAERAEVSPSTVLRYFPAREDIVLADEDDTLLLEEVRRRPADEPWPDTVRQVLRRAVRHGIDTDEHTARLRARLMVQVPAVRSRMRESMSATGRTLGRAVAERTGRDPDDLEVRAYATALTGTLLETSLYWAEHGHRDDLTALVDRALDALPPGKDH